MSPRRSDPSTKAVSGLFVGHSDNGGPQRRRSAPSPAKSPLWPHASDAVLPGSAVESALHAATCECLPSAGALALKPMPDTLDLPNL
jgi:hypothetical protein